jgi:hypothetical protein
MRVLVKKNRSVSICQELASRLAYLERELAFVDWQDGWPSSELFLRLASIHSERMSYELVLAQLQG